MSKDLKDLINTVEEKESNFSELEQEVKLLKENIEKLNFTISEQKFLIQEQEKKVQKSEVFELPGDIRILKDMLVSQRLEIKKRDKDVEILEQEIENLTGQLKVSKNRGVPSNQNEDLIKAKKFIVQLTEENERYKANENETESLIKKLMKENEDYLLQIDALKAENQNLDIQHSNGADSLKREVEQLRSKVVQLKQKLKSNDSTLEKLEMKFEGVKEIPKDLETIAEDDAKLKRDFNTAKITIDNLVKEITKHLKEIAEQDKEIRGKNTKINVLKEKIESLKRRNMKLQEEFEGISRETPILVESNIGVSEDFLKDLQEENKRLNERILELEETKISQRRDLDAYDKDELEELINYLKNENLQLKKSLIELKENNSGTYGKIVENDQPYNELIDMNKNLLVENKKLQTELKEIKSRINLEVKYNFKFDHSAPQYYQNLLFMRILNSLDKYKREIVIDLLIQDLATTQNLDIKRFLIEILSEIKDERRIRDSLVQLMNSDDWLVRLHLVKALGKFNKAEDIKHTLEVLMEDSDLDVRDAAKDALRKIS